MNTLHRLAGVQDATRPDTESPNPVQLRAQDDDARSFHSQSNRKATLPLHHRRSNKSFRSGGSRPQSLHSTKNGDGRPLDQDIPAVPPLPSHLGQPPVPPKDNALGEEEDEDFEDAPWGPQHPCFPHPNPHCTPGSEEARSTRVLRVKRDWFIAGDLYPQYANIYPEILDPLVTDDEFRDLISNINEIAQRSFSPYTTRAWVDSLLGAATGYIYEDLGLSGAKRGEKELERYINNWNSAREKEGREVRLIQLRTTGFMSLDFIVPDPGIDQPAEEEEYDQNEEQAAELSGIGPAE